MATITQHAPGTFCWPELSTSDQAAARTFYTSLFGWTVQETPIGEGETYTMLFRADQPVGALYRASAEERAQGVPPHWNSYVAVASADEAAAKAKQLGGKILVEPFDVMEHGRMAIIQDPTGAAFCVWQAKQHIGAGVLNETGSLCWTELMTTDTDRAGQFYASLFGWKGASMPIAGGPSAGSPYTVFNRGEQMAGGMMPIPKQSPGTPSNWLIYYQVENCDKSAARAAELGAKVQVPPTDIPNVGRFSVLQDPQGAYFGILAYPSA
ncbi:MAG TPA: VOC family protein [Candidatus Limnocylindria bacterium]|nr:VOC family protein [Candidatus Limnocylindria bacterium]